jgi:hypothetical protein
MDPWQLAKLGSKMTKMSDDNIHRLLANPEQVKKVHVPLRENPIVNRLNKTKEEKFPNFRQEKEDREKELREREQASRRDRLKEEKRVAMQRKEKAWQRDHAYDDMFSEDNVAMASNAERGTDFEDDFM